MRKVLLVTGGSRGIGAATCLLAAQKGWDVAVNYSANAQAADGIVEQIKSAGGPSPCRPMWRTKAKCWRCSKKCAPSWGLCKAWSTMRAL